MDVRNINVLVLAFIGDSVYEDYVRHMLLSKGFPNVNDMQSETIKYVSAKAQSEFLNRLINDRFLTEEELDVVKRARNYKSSRHPKNIDIITYKWATGFEALIGYLDVINNKERVIEIFNYIFG